MITIRGHRSTIGQELLRLLPPGESTVFVERGTDGPVDAERHVFLRGVMIGRRVADLSAADINEVMRVNFFDVVAECDLVLKANPSARIVVVGSESGYSWSFDDAYAASKAALHRWVETRRIGPGQQLVCVAPTIIEDSGMTRRRRDSEVVAVRAAGHPKMRWLRAIEVARMVHYLLYVDEGYTTGCVIRMHGGGGR